MYCHIFLIKQTKPLFSMKHKLNYYIIANNAAYWMPLWYLLLSLRVIVKTVYKTNKVWFVVLIIYIRVF